MAAATAAAAIVLLFNLLSVLQIVGIVYPPLVRSDSIGREYHVSEDPAHRVGVSILSLTDYA